MGMLHKYHIIHDQTIGRSQTRRQICNNTHFISSVSTSFWTSQEDVKLHFRGDEEIALSYLVSIEGIAV